MPCVIYVPVVDTSYQYVNITINFMYQYSTRHHLRNSYVGPDSSASSYVLVLVVLFLSEAGFSITNRVKSSKKRIVTEGIYQFLKCYRVLYRIMYSSYRAL